MSTAVKIAILALALIAVWWLAMTPPPAPHEPAAVSGSGAMPIRAVAPIAGQAAAAPHAVPVPAEPAQEPAQEAPAPVEAPSTTKPHETPPTRQGPVDELAKRFAGESRGENSDADDKRVREAFTDPTIPPTLLHSAECRRSVCRVELRWSPQTDVAYVLGLTRAVGSFSAALGIEGAGDPDPQGVRPLTVYFSLNH